MINKHPKILVITPTNHIKGVNKILNSIGKVDYLEDPTKKQVEII